MLRTEKNIISAKSIESEDMVQTAYEFTIYEKVKKKG